MENNVVSFENKPITPIGYVGYFMVIIFPIIGFILWIVWAVSHKNVNVRNLCRGLLLHMLIVIILCVAFGSVIKSVVLSIF